MGINVRDFRHYIVDPTCDACERLAEVPGPPFVRDLLVATAAIETQFGVWLHQTGGGDAVSAFQFEPSVLTELVRGFILPHPSFKSVYDWCANPSLDLIQQVETNFLLAAVCARFYYYRVPEALPADTSLQTLWQYYKTYWNTDAGAATLPSFQAALRLTDIKV